MVFFVAGCFFRKTKRSITDKNLRTYGGEVLDNPVRKTKKAKTCYWTVFEGLPLRMGGLCSRRSYIYIG